MSAEFDRDDYYRRELRLSRERIATLETHRSELERVVAALLDMITPNRNVQHPLLAAVEQALRPPRLISDHLLSELLRGP